MKIVYIKTTENCNLNCKHCFVPHVNNFMKDEVFDKVVEKLNFFKNEKMNIIWHGGEPTLIGYKKMEEFLVKIKNKNNNENINHHIQTNLLSYDNNWKNIYEEYFDSFVGISYDFDIRFFGKDEKKEILFWEKFNKLRNDGLSYNLIVTVTKKVLDLGPDDFFKWIIDKGITNIHLERLTKSGYAINHWDEIGFTNKEYNNFMKKLFLIYFNYLKLNKFKNNLIHMSPFESMLVNIPKKQTFSCAGSCKNFFTFNPDGEVGGCTSTTLKLGNVDQDMRKMARKNFIDKKKCLDCDFKDICKSGCDVLTEIFDESGECIGNYELLKLRQNLSSKIDIHYDLSIKEIFNEWNK